MCAANSARREKKESTEAAEVLDPAPRTHVGPEMEMKTEIMKVKVEVEVEAYHRQPSFKTPCSENGTIRTPRDSESWEVEGKDR